MNIAQSAFTQSNNSCSLGVMKKGEGCFSYKVKSGNFEIPVYYYLPNKLQAKTEVLFAMHGEKRNAQDYRNDWRNIYNSNSSGKSDFILLVPQFEQRWFPKATGYNLGKMFTEDLKILNPRNQWAFSEIENIFTFVKRSTKINANKYYLYGHSAGAQFVHRMLIFMRYTHIQKAVAAEAGSYTIPDEHREYPCGLKKLIGEPLTSVDLKTTFTTPMTIILGTKDNKVLSREHDSYSCDTQQGSNRLARGEYFYTHVKNIAHNIKSDFNWTLKEVTATHIVANTNPPIEDPMLVSCAALEFFPKLTEVSCK
jgi:poly(3-hydroxybutyrate) depolymerase